MRGVEREGTGGGQREPFDGGEGIQVFTGTIEAPTFSLATFTSNDTAGLAGSQTTIKITDLTPPPPPTTVTPEPSSIALLGTGLLGVVGMVRKRFA